MNEIKLTSSDVKNSTHSCHFCFNARVCPPSDDPYETPLTDENDFGSFGIGNCKNGYSLMIHTGYGRQQNITARKWNDKIGMWLDIGVYEPKFCPECGRKLDEYKEKSYSSPTREEIIEKGLDDAIKDWNAHNHDKGAYEYIDEFLSSLDFQLGYIYETDDNEDYLTIAFVRENAKIGFIQYHF